VTIIRRWECPEDGELAGWWKGPEERLVLHCGHCDTPMEKVEYVPADQLAGVVEALRDVAIPSLAYCEQKYGYDDQARLNCEATLRRIGEAVRP
jgi:hypothetical protein